MSMHVHTYIYLPIVVMSVVEAFTDTCLSKTPSSSCGHTLTVVVTPSVAFNVVPMGKPITTTKGISHRDLLIRCIIEFV